MAEEITLSGAGVKKRNPWGIWLLSLITLGVYGLVWWYKVNRELRDYSAGRGRPFDNDPALAVLALFPGALVVVPPFFTWVYTTQRIRSVQEMTGGTDPVNSWLVVLLALLGSFHMIYLQYALNSSWDRARGDQPAPPVAAVEEAGGTVAGA